MGSKNDRTKGRSDETKVKNRSKKKIFIEPILNMAKAKELIARFRANGFHQATDEQLLDGVRSLRQLRHKIGLFMSNE